MAIAFDASTDGGSVSSTSLTYAHTCTGSNGILFVGVYGDATSITGATYAGVAMKLLSKRTSTSGPAGYVFQLVNPSTGANNVVVSASGTITIASMCASYTGANQSDIEDALAVGTQDGVGSGSWTGPSITTITNNDWVLMFTVKTFTEAPTAQNGWTTRESAASLCLIDHNGPEAIGNVSPVVAHTGGSQNYAHIVVAFSPAATTLTYGKALTFNGTSQYAERATSGSSVTNNFSMATWAYVIALPGSSACLFHNGSNDARGQQLQINSTGRFSADYAFVANINSSFMLSTGHWYHLGLIRNAGTSQCYVNGISQGSTSGSAPNSGTDWITLGSSQNNAGTNDSFANVILDDARLYERAITAAEMYELAHNGAKWPYTDISSANLYYHYKLDETSGDPQDSSGNSRHLTATGSPTYGAGIVATGTGIIYMGSLLTMFR